MGKKLEVIITGDARGAMDAFDGLGGAADGFGGKLTALGGVAVGAFAVVAAAAAGVGLGLFKIGEEFDKAGDQIRVKTGATGEQLGELKGVFKDVVQDVPADFGEASTAISTLNAKLGLTGEPLRNVSENLLDLSRITGTDVKTNTEAAAKVFGNWNVAAGDQATTLDLLFRVTQKTGIGFDELGAALAGGGVKLRELGFSLEDSAALFGTLSKAGIESADVLPAFSKAIANSAKNGVDAETALRNYTAAIAAAPNDTIAAQKAIELFGAKAGPQLAGMIREGKLNFEQLAAAVKGGGDTIAGAANDTEDFGEKLTRMKNRAMVAIEPLATKVFDAVGQAIDKLGPYFDKFSVWLSENMPRAMAWFETSVIPAAQRVGDVLGKVFDGIGRVVDWARGLFQNAGGESNGGMSDTMKKVMHIGEQLRSTFESIGKFLGEIMGYIADVWQKYGGQITEFFHSAFDGVLTFFSGVLDQIRGVFDTFSALFRGDWEGVWKGLLTIVQGIGEQITGLFQGLGNALLGILTGIGGLIQRVLENIFDGLKRAIIGAINWVIDKWNGLSFSTPNIPGTDFGGVTIGVPQIPHLHTGGTFVAPTPGGEGYALLRDGERVSTPSSSPTETTSSEATVNVNLYFPNYVGDPEQIARAVAPALVDVLRSREIAAR